MTECTEIARRRPDPAKWIAGVVEAAVDIESNLIDR